MQHANNRYRWRHLQSFFFILLFIVPLEIDARIGAWNQACMQTILLSSPPLIAP